MPEGKKQNINIKIAGLNPIPLQIEPDDEQMYRIAESGVNSVWIKWMQRFKGKCTSEEVMARVAFQFALHNARAKELNDDAENLLSEFENKLDELVVKNVKLLRRFWR